MTRATWIELVGVLVVMGGVAWLFGLLRFRIYLGELSRARLPERVRGMRQTLRALEVLLSSLGGPAKAACLDEIELLRRSLSLAEGAEKTARRLVLLRPFHAERRVVDAWRGLPRWEGELKALLFKIEDQLWRRRKAVLTGPSVQAQRAAVLGAVDARLGEVMAIWPALEEHLFSRHKLSAGPSPAALVARARAASEHAEAWSDLADAAWLCVAGAEWQRRRILEPYTDPERVVQTLHEATRQRTDARKSPPRPDTPGHAKRQASFDEAERLFTEGETLLGLLAWRRAERALQGATHRYQDVLGRVSIPMDASPLLARLLRPGKPRGEEHEQDREDPDWDLPGSWPGSDDPGTSADSVGVSDDISHGGSSG